MSQSKSKHLEGMSYKESLRTLELSGLEGWRLRGDFTAPGSSLRRSSRGRCWYFAPWSLMTGCVGTAQSCTGAGSDWT